MLFLVKNLASTIHHCANEFFIVDIAMRVLLIHQKLLNLKKVSALAINISKFKTSILSIKMENSQPLKVDEENARWRQY